MTYSVSMFAVASSRIKILLFFRIARARQTNWRWPELKFEPHSETVVSRPPGRFFIVSFNSTWNIAWGYFCGEEIKSLFTCSNAFQMSPSDFSPSGSKFDRRLPTNNIGSWGIIEIFWRNVCKPKSLRSTPSISIIPSTTANWKIACVMLVLPAPDLKKSFFKNV